MCIYHVFDVDFCRLCMKITNEVGLGCRCLYYNNDKAHGLGLQREYKLGKYSETNKLQRNMQL